MSQKNIKIILNCESLHSFGILAQSTPIIIEPSLSTEMESYGSMISISYFHPLRRFPEIFCHNDNGLNPGCQTHFGQLQQDAVVVEVLKDWTNCGSHNPYKTRMFLSADAGIVLRTLRRSSLWRIPIRASQIMGFQI